MYSVYCKIVGRLFSNHLEIIFLIIQIIMQYSMEALSTTIKCSSHWHNSLYYRVSAVRPTMRDHI